MTMKAIGRIRHIDRRIVADIINNIRSADFDTHAVEQRLILLQPIAFADDLRSFRDAKKPLQRFSAELSKWIGKEFSADLVKCKGKVLSRHLGGEKCENQQWTKRNPGVPII